MPKKKSYTNTLLPFLLKLSERAEVLEISIDPNVYNLFIGLKLSKSVRPRAFMQMLDDIGFPQIAQMLGGKTEVMMMNSRRKAAYKFDGQKVGLQRMNRLKPASKKLENKPDVAVLAILKPNNEEALFDETYGVPILGQILKKPLFHGRTDFPSEAKVSMLFQEDIEFDLPWQWEEYTGRIQFIPELDHLHILVGNELSNMGFTLPFFIRVDQDSIDCYPKELMDGVVQTIRKTYRKQIPEQPILLSPRSSFRRGNPQEFMEGKPDDDNQAKLLKSLFASPVGHILAWAKSPAPFWWLMGGSFHVEFTEPTDLSHLFQYTSSTTYVYPPTVCEHARQAAFLMPFFKGIVSDDAVFLPDEVHAPVITGFVGGSNEFVTVGYADEIMIGKQSLDFLVHEAEMDINGEFHDGLHILFKRGAASMQFDEDNKTQELMLEFIHSYIATYHREFFMELTEDFMADEDGDFDEEMKPVDIAHDLSAIAGPACRSTKDKEQTHV